MQVGGVQEAITLAPPALGVVRLPALLAPTVADCDELQVKGTPVIVFPKVTQLIIDDVRAGRGDRLAHSDRAADYRRARDPARGFVFFDDGRQDVVCLGVAV